MTEPIVLDVLPDDLENVVLSVFAGIGGWEVALAERGLTGAGVEINAHAIATRRAAGQVTVATDVRALSGWPGEPRSSIFAGDKTVMRRGVDVIGAVGSPPCQTRSQAAGADDRVDDDRHGLLFEYGRLVLEALPGFVCAEITPRGAADLEGIAVELRKHGYTAEVRVVSAADYGLPQDRRRALLAARRDGKPLAWPKPTHAGAHVPMSAALDLHRHEHLPAWVFERASTTVVGSFRPEILAAPGWRKPGDLPRQDTPNSVEASVEERLALQGFPRTWPVQGPKTAVGLQVGNAIPPTLARVALAAVLDDAGPDTLEPLEAIPATPERNRTMTEARRTKTAADRAVDELNRANRLADSAVVKRDNLRAQLKVTEETLVAALKRRDYAAANPDLPDVMAAHTGASARLEVAEVHGMTVAVERAERVDAERLEAGSAGDAAEPEEIVDAAAAEPLEEDPWDRPATVDVKGETAAASL